MADQNAYAPLLSLIVFVPLLGALSLYLAPFQAGRCRGSQDALHERMRRYALGVTLFTFILSLAALALFDSSRGGFQLMEQRAWIAELGVSYALGIDGVSLALVLLTAALMPVVVLAARPKSRLRGYLASMLVLETAMLGALVSLDLFLFYVFWELMLAPMYFIIGIWGGKRRIYAAVKFVLYTLSGSLLMLAALIYVSCQYYQQQNELSFFLPDLLRYVNFSRQEELWLFGAFALAFAIKVPVFPFHTWLPDAHVEAPTGGSVVLAGILLKMGIYGFIRLGWPLFPQAAGVYAPYLALLGTAGIIYGALMAWAQSDIKKLIAYSSVSHLGFCVLGLCAFKQATLTGVVYQMISHGLSTGALFLLAGFLYERRRSREISAFGGLCGRMPVFAFIFMVFTLSSIALPLTSGFVGEFMILAGSFSVYPRLVIAALLGVVLGAVYMLALYLKTMFGELDQEKNGELKDLNRTELWMTAPLAFLVFVLGVYPGPFLQRIDQGVRQAVSLTQGRSEMLRLNRMNVGK